MLLNLLMDAPESVRGVHVRHGRNCGTRAGDDCDCWPGFQAHVWDAENQHRIRRTFESMSQALAWRASMGVVERNHSTVPATRRPYLIGEAREYAVILRRDPCSYCEGEGGSVDHIDPPGAGGTHDAENLTGACMTCNRSKSNRPLLRFMLERVA